jgi:hypothetical protein
MTAAEAYRRVADQFPPDFVGRFYSGGAAVGLGKGKIYKSIICPLFDPGQGHFVTIKTLAYVLTHECDVDQANERVFNDEVLVCPILPLHILIEEYEAALAGELLPAFLGNLGQRNVSRLAFLPAIPDVIDYGGVLYLNQISHTHRTAFDAEEAQQVCAVTAYGLEHMEYALENHLLRPKADRLALGPHQ